MISTLVLDAPASAQAAPAPSAAPLRGIGHGSVAYLVIFALGVLALMFVLGGLQTVADQAWAAAITLAPAALALRLAFTSQADRQQYVARLMACALMLPLLVLMWASSQTLTEAPVVVGLAFVLAGALHLAAFVGATVVLASRTTRLMPASGIAPVGAERLVRRLASLGITGGRFTLPAASDRRHDLTLTLDDRQPLVHVRERLTAAGAAPQNADEASLRSLGDEAFDPARPDAQQVWSLTLQTSMIDPQRLAEVPLRFVDDQATLPAGYVDRLDADGWLALLAALVTASGYTWQPAFFNRTR